MSIFIYIIIFLFGSIIGSFINCVVYRLHAKKSFIHGRSLCPKCFQQLKWHHNIPIFSFIFLKARCYFCKQKISVQYLIVELMTGILFLLVYIFSHNLVRDLIFTSILIIIFIYDLRYYLILDKITIPAMVIALIFNFADIYQVIIAGLVAGGFFLLQFLISKGKWIGGGDIRLGLLMGFMLGWPNVLVALFLAYILGSIIGIGLIIAKKKNMQSQVPFGTFLAVGTLIALLWGNNILNWYLDYV